MTTSLVHAIAVIKIVMRGKQHTAVTYANGMAVIMTAIIAIRQTFRSYYGKKNF